MLKKLFVPYEPSLDLKELGFNEPCLAKYCKYNLTDKIELFPQSQDFFKGYFNQCTNSEYKKEAKVAAPLYQQAFRWFREKYGYLSNIHDFNGNFKATLSGNCNWLGSWTKTYEEAELACLIKLIEIVKNNE